MVRVCLVLVMLLLNGAALADVAPADWREQASDQIWEERLRPALFQDRPVVEGPGQNVLELKAPYRAEDATVVPISILTRISQSSDEYVKRIHVLIDKNPVPLVGTFEFSAASGRADLALRVRVDDFSFIRAVAELNSGRLYLAKSFVRASGACSAPPPRSIDDSIANMGSMKVKTIGEVKFDEPNLVQLQIKHPNITGLQPMRVGSRVRPPAHFVRQIKVDYAGTAVMQAQLTFSISMDPSLRFFFVPHGPGKLSVEVVDTQDNHWTAVHPITPASESAARR